MPTTPAVRSTSSIEAHPDYRIFSTSAELTNCLIRISYFQSLANCDLAHSLQAHFPRLLKGFPTDVSSSGEAQGSP